MDYHRDSPKTRQKFCAALAQGKALGLFPNGSGNAALRLAPVCEARRFLVTPTGVDKDLLDPDRLGVANGNGEHVGGDSLSCETLLLVKMLNNFPDYAVVVHTHGFNTGLAAIKLWHLEPLKQQHAYFLESPILQVPLVAGTSHDLLADETLMTFLEAPADRAPNAAIIERHGGLVLGHTIDEAFRAAQELEDLAYTYYSLQLLGETPVPLDHEIALANRMSYLQKLQVKD